MDERRRHVVATITVVSIVVRLALALAHTHDIADVEGFRPVAAAVRAGHPGALYHQAAAWIYPPGFLPWLGIAGWLDSHTALEFAFIVRLPLITADVATGLAIYWFLGRRGVADPVRLCTLVSVLVGPLFIFNSTYGSQLDCLAMLPAILGVMFWIERPDDRRRPLVAGGLIGVGAVVKTFPLFLVLALLPTARGWRERVWLPAMATGVLLLSMAPFIRHDLDAVHVISSTTRLPGAGGLSLVVQPSLVRFWLDTRTWVPLSGASSFFLLRNNLVTTVVVGVTFAVAMRRRMPPEQAAGSWFRLPSPVRIALPCSSRSC